MGDTQSVMVGTVVMAAGALALSPPARQTLARRLPMLSSTHHAAGGDTAVGSWIRFGGYRVGADKVFYAPLTRDTVVFSEMSPIVFGHLIVAPIRPAVRIDDMTSNEWLDLIHVARTAQRLVGNGATAFNLALKDGAAAGQSVRHAHLHVVPRVGGDMAPDVVYGLLDAWHPVEGESNSPPPIDFPDDASRAPRSRESMAAEAARYFEAVEAAGMPTAPLPTPEDTQMFGPHTLQADQFFYASKSGLTLAMVNLKPLMPGHTLVISRRVVPTLDGLTEEELRDLWQTVREVKTVIMDFYGATGVTLGIQDGVDAGQSVPHVHVHILPVGLSHNSRL